MTHAGYFFQHFLGQGFLTEFGLALNCRSHWVKMMVLLKVSDILTHLLTMASLCAPPMFANVLGLASLTLIH
jgi:hypothetical protein